MFKYHWMASIHKSFNSSDPNISLSGEESREEKQYPSYIIQTYIVQTSNQNSNLYNSKHVRLCCHELGNTMVVTAHNMHMLDIRALHILGK